MPDFARKKKQHFYQQLLRVYDASLHFMERAAQKADEMGRTEMAKSLTHLTQGAPRTLYEAMQTTMIYYTLQHYFDSTYLRTLGRLDKLFYPFYKKESENPETAAANPGLLVDYIKEIDSWKAVANIPFALGGTDADGKCLINELSYLLLDTYRQAQTVETKLHLLCSANTPDSFLSKAFEAIRAGDNSMIFLSDEKIIESLEKIGISREDAVRYHVVGCYECGGEEELTCSCNARVNIPKALELALNNGKDMLTGKQIGLPLTQSPACFDDLYAEFKRQLTYLCQCAMKLTDLYEANYPRIHAAPIFSATYTSALEKGGDLYLDYAAKYNNSSVNAIGLATASDSLAAIRKLVYQDQRLSLSEFTEILRSNWKDQTPLRLLIKNRYPKYGLGDPATDALAKGIVDTLADAISGKPNAKGGVFRLGLFSINWTWSFGEKTAASADGRLAGDPLSQNTGATSGADREGATAHLTSVASIDTSRTPNGSIADIALHSSAVQGENGIRTLTATLKTYFELGGFGVHYNILDVATLKDAKLHPEKYPNLQVRLCGWNILFSSLTDKEKDEVIHRFAQP